MLNIPKRRRNIDMKIKDLMKKPVVTEKDVTLSDAAKVMNKYSINSLIVVRDEKIVGIVTHHDLIKYFGQPKKVFEIMTKSVITVKDDDKIQKAIELVREKEIGIFPVVDNKGKLVGILDSKDLLKVWDEDDFLIE
ncbi:CBS domain-containing protein [Candidatus Pacearchaeota archaeon]|nr:CBS domain-containing protein [Candidatus Pacearchaeota archaeon]